MPLLTLQRIFDFYLDASIHVALAVYALLYVTAFFLDLPVDGHLFGFIFFGTIACYNFMKYGVEAEKYILVANRYHKNIQFFSFGCLAAAFYFSLFLHLDVFVALGVLLMLTGLYALPLLPGTKNLRNFGGFKIFVVALVWSGATVFLPVIAVGFIITWDVWIEAMQRFLIVLILLVPFEIRDLKFDSPELNTLPQHYGVEKSKLFGHIANIIFFMLSFLKDITMPAEILLKGVLFLVLFAVIFFTKREQTKYYASFWVEAVPIFWLMLIWFFYK